jgi:putative spermidine/putrescine transport system permease protein
MRIEVGSAYTLIFFIVVLPLLWALQAVANEVQKRYGT